jgi:hypothetical protein
VAKLIPGLPTDIFKKVDKTMADVDVVLGRVDTTLADVSTTLADATAVLSDVRGLLAELHDELELLREVPAMKVKIEEIHAAVVATKKR